MSESARLRLPFLAAAQAQKHVTHNEALVALDTLVQPSVIDKDLAAPPGSPAEGDCYIVAASATGAWTGWDGRIARYEDGDWRSFLPGAGEGAGRRAWVEDEAALYVFDGDAWVPIAGEAFRRAPIAQAWGYVPPAPLKRRVMASPPTPTYTTAVTIASPRYIGPGLTDAFHNGTQLTYSRAGDLWFGAAEPDYRTTFFRSLDPSVGIRANGYMVSFMHLGQKLEIMSKAGLQEMLLKVDDAYVSLTPQVAGNSGSTYYWYFDFGSVDRRRIDFLCGGDRGFQGIVIGPNDCIEPAPLRGPRVIVIGDSFVEWSPLNCVHVFADAIGFDDVRPSGIGSTGWTTAGAGPYVTIPARLADDVIRFSPDIVVNLAGGNDQGAGASYATMYAAVAGGLAQIRAALPNCLLVNMGPCASGGPGRHPAALYTEILPALHDAFIAAGGYSLPLVELPLPDDYEQPAITMLADAAIGATTVRISSNAYPEFTLAPVGRNDRFYVKAISGSPTWTASLDGTLKAAIANGAALRMVGNSLWTGTGYVGATTGFGNGDILVGADGTHPTLLGHRVIGETMAMLMIRLLRRLVAQHALEG